MKTFDDKVSNTHVLTLSATPSDGHLPQHATFTAMSAPAKAPTRPRPRPRPRSAASSSVNAKSTIANGSTPASVDAEDAMFMRNSNRTLNTWKELEKKAECS